MRNGTMRKLLLPAAILVSLGTGYAFAAQPHMAAALAALQNARAQLQAASSDKGGHRVAAIGLIDQAIAQVRQGVAVGAGK